MEVSCLEDIEMEEYGDEPESFAESLSESAGPSTRTIPWSEHPSHPSRRSAEDLLLDNPRPTGKCKAAVTIEDVFHAQLSSGIRELIVLHTNE
ncbi:DNA helicase/primase complex-associated protein [Trichinella spiralis]|uniref:DNA helicase/primase complex-associated protein n=1 Tax=Trichinella spiralis TaxID=6334 RepID=A0ABR3KES3_TRISP